MNTADKEYIALLNDLKQKIIAAQQRAVFSVNKEMLILYWEIGKMILEKQKKAKWGSKVIDNLSVDLKNSFPGMKGFSPRNLKYMRKFAELYQDIEFVQGPLAQIPWYHNIALIEKLGNHKERKVNM